MIIESVYNDSLQTIVVGDKGDAIHAVPKVIRLNLIKRFSSECGELGMEEVNPLLPKLRISIVKLKDSETDVPVTIGTLGTPISLVNDDSRLTNFNRELNPEMKSVNISKLRNLLRGLSKSTSYLPSEVEEVGISSSFPVTARDVQQWHAPESDTYSDDISSYNSLLEEIGEMDPTDRLYSMLGVARSQSAPGAKDSAYADQVANEGTYEIVEASSILALDQVLRSNPGVQISDDMLLDSAKESVSPEFVDRLYPALKEFRDASPSLKSQRINEAMKITRDKRSGMTKLQRRLLRVSIATILIGGLVYTQRHKISNANKLGRSGGKFNLRNFSKALFTSSGRRDAGDYANALERHNVSEEFLTANEHRLARAKAMKLEAAYDIAQVLKKYKKG